MWSNFHGSEVLHSMVQLSWLQETYRLYRPVVMVIGNLQTILSSCHSYRRPTAVCLRETFASFLTGIHTLLTRIPNSVGFLVM